MYLLTSIDGKKIKYQYTGSYCKDKLGKLMETTLANISTEIVYLLRDLLLPLQSAHEMNRY